MRHIMIDNENVHLKICPIWAANRAACGCLRGFLQDKIPTELTQSLLALQKDKGLK